MTKRLYGTEVCWGLVNKTTGELDGTGDGYWTYHSRAEARIEKKFSVDDPKDWKIVKVHSTHREV